MAVRRVSRPTPRTSATPLPATAQLFQKPLTAWYAEWKANKTRTETPAAPRPSAPATSTG